MTMSFRHGSLCRARWFSFQSFPQKALVSSSGMGRDVHSLMLPIQHFLFQPRCRPPSKLNQRTVLERLSWRVSQVPDAEPTACEVGRLIL